MGEISHDKRLSSEWTVIGKLNLFLCILPEIWQLLCITMWLEFAHKTQNENIKNTMEQPAAAAFKMLI